jgi:hypothetical protein
MFRYNYSSGAIDANPSLVPQFLASLSAEIPRYTALWNQRFQPISVANYKVRYTPVAQYRSLTQQQLGVPQEFTVSGAEWFRQNNFTALPILLVNPVALYGYGDINIVPAVGYNCLYAGLAGILHACANDRLALHPSVLHARHFDRLYWTPWSVLYGLPQDVR